MSCAWKKRTRKRKSEPYSATRLAHARSVARPRHMLQEPRFSKRWRGRGTPLGPRVRKTGQCAHHRIGPTIPMFNLASRARPYFGALVLTTALLVLGGIYSAT